MQKEEITKIIKDFLIDEFEIEEDLIKPNAILKDDLGLESLDFVDIAVIIEREFGLKLKNEEMVDVRTFDDICEHIYKKLN